RLQPYLVETGGQKIRPGARAELTEAVGEGDCEFAFGPERGDRIAHLLRGGQRQRVATDPGINSLDPGVVAGAFERVETIAQRLLSAKNQGRQRIVAGALGETAAEIDAEHDRFR